MKCARKNENDKASFFPNDVIPQGWENIDISHFNDYVELADGYNNGKYIIENSVMVLNPDYEEEQADLREANFKSKFFNIEGFGWYRKQPKGYQSAIESLNTAFNRFSLMQKMGIDTFPANVFIFYAEPDFTKPEECTEEWLVAHQTKNEAMTAQEFGSFYAAFTDAWNTEEHE